MRSGSDDVFRNSTEISQEEEDELKIPKNRDSLEDPPVFYMDKNVTACELPEIVVSNCKELTYNVVKDICVDESLPMMQGKDSIEVLSNPFESKSKEESKFEEFLDIQDSSKLNQENLIVTREEVKVDSEVVCDTSSSRDLVVATSRSVSKEALTLGDIISMEDSLKPPNNNGSENTEESKANSLRDLDGNFLPREKKEPENEKLNYVLEDSYDHHHLFSSRFTNGFGERSFPEAEPGLAHITYSGPISVSGSLSVGSDGSTVSTHSFAFPILQSEWNSSPVRMARPEKRQVMVNPEKRHLREKKGWRHFSLLLCCRF